MSRVWNAALGAIAALGFSSAFAQETYVIENARFLVTGSADDPGTLDEGRLVIRNGKIASLGTVSAPSGATVIDAEGGVVTPGLIAPISGLGLTEIGLNTEGNDGTLSGEFTFSAAIRAADALYADSVVIPISRAGGVTRAFSAISPGRDLFGGCGVLIDLTGDADPILRSCAGQVMAFGYGAARRNADNRAAAMLRLRSIFGDVLEYVRAPAAYGGLAAEKLPGADAALLAPVVEGDLPLFVTVNGAGDIRRLVAFTEEYGIDLVIVGGAEAWRVADLLAENDIPVILNPLNNLPGQFETLASRLDAAARLEDAGVTVAFYDDDIGYTHNLRLLPQLAGNAVANGMSYEGAVEALTVAPAQIFGMEDEVGTLAPGKVADIVIWDGDPLELSTRPTHVFIGGDLQSLDNRQSDLAERYRDLSGMGDRPPAYRRPGN